MKSNIDFINTNTTKALLRLFIPLMLAMTLTMAYSMVDSLWVGNLLGEAGMSALTASTAIVLIMNSLSMGVGNGVSVMIAQLVGARDKAGIQRAAAVIMTVSLLFSVTLCVAGEFLAEYILRAMGTPSEVLPDAVSYLRLYLIGNVALFLYMQFTSIFNTATLYKTDQTQKVLQVTAMKYGDTWVISDNCVIDTFIGPVSTP